MYYIKLKIELFLIFPFPISLANLNPTIRVRTDWSANCSLPSHHLSNCSESRLERLAATSPKIVKSNGLETFSLIRVVCRLLCYVSTSLVFPFLFCLHFASTVQSDIAQSTQRSEPQQGGFAYPNKKFDFAGQSGCRAKCLEMCSICSQLVTQLANKSLVNLFGEFYFPLQLSAIIGKPSEE